MTRNVESLGYTLSEHAKERIRQRVGLVAEPSAIAWVSEAIKKAKSTRSNGKTTSYFTDMFEIVLDGLHVVTVKPTTLTSEYVSKINDLVSKEVSKMLAEYKRELRKAEIEVAEAQLNFLKARNPKVRQSIQQKLTEAIDRKALIEDEIKAIECAGRRYGVEI